MAKTSGSNGGLPNGDSNYKGTVGKLEPLASIKNPKVYKTVKESISRFHSVLGVRQKDIKIGQLEAGTGGVHISQNGVSSVQLYTFFLHNTFHQIYFFLLDSFYYIM